MEEKERQRGKTSDKRGKTCGNPRVRKLIAKKRKARTKGVRVLGRGAL